MSGRLIAALAVVLALWSGGTDRFDATPAHAKPNILARQPGWLLVAAPSMPDRRFARTGILMSHHE